MNLHILDVNKNYEIKSGLLIQTPEARPLPGAILRVKRGLITQIIPTGVEIPWDNENLELIDLSNYTILPGLVDCHVHLALDGKDFKHALARWDRKAELEQHLAGSLLTTLEHGILAVRDGGDARGLTLELRTNPQAGNSPAPRIVATGWAIRRAGMYGSFLGPGLTGESIEAAVEKLAQAGADQIKILVSGIVSFKEYGLVGQSQFDLKSLTALVRHIHHLGLRAMAHASSPEAVQLALEARVDSLEHGYFLDHRSINQLAAAKTPWIPTLAPVANQLRGCAPESAEIIRQTCRRQQEMVAAAATAGVVMGIGTDAGATGVRHGQGFLDEVKLLREAGLTPAQILRAATVDGARVLGLERELGRLEVGIPPNLIAVVGNPLYDLGALEKVSAVIIG